MEHRPRTALLLLAMAGLGVLLAGCRDRKRSSSRGNGSSSSDETTTQPAAASPLPTGTAAPVAEAPSLTDYRRPPSPVRGTTLAIQCNIPGRLAILDGADNVLDSNEGRTPRAVCVVPPVIAGSSPCVQVRFEPADGSPGTQRLVRLPAGEGLVARRLLPPNTTRPAWTVEVLQPPVKKPTTRSSGS